MLALITIIAAPIAANAAGQVRVQVFDQGRIAAFWEGPDQTIPGFDQTHRPHYQFLTRSQELLFRELEQRTFGSRDDAFSECLDNGERASRAARHTEAAQWLRVAVTLQPTSARAHELLLASIRASHSEGAWLEEYRWYLDRFPANAAVRAAIAQLEGWHADRGLLDRGVDTVIQEAARTKQQDRQKALGMIARLAELLAQAGRGEEAAPAHLFLAQEHRAGGQKAEALASYKAYLQAIARVEPGEWEKAKGTYLEAFQAVLDLSHELGDHQGLLDWLRGFREKTAHPSFRSDSLEWIDFAIGEALRFLRRYAEAEDQFLAVYLNYPSGRYSEAAKERHENCKRAKEGQALLRVTTEPAGAEVWLDGRQAATSPAELRVPEGKKKVELRLPFHEQWVQEVELFASEPANEIRAELRTAELELQAASADYCPGAVIGIEAMGKIVWHDDCFGLAALEVTGELERIGANRVRLRPGTYRARAQSFGDRYRQRKRFVSFQLELPPGSFTTLRVQGAYVGDPEYPYRIATERRGEAKAVSPSASSPRAPAR